MQPNSAPVTCRDLAAENEQRASADERASERTVKEDGDEGGESARTRFIHEERADNSARSLLPIHYFAKR